MVGRGFLSRRKVVAQFGPHVRWVVRVPWWWFGGGASWLRFASWRCPVAWWWVGSVVAVAVVLALVWSVVGVAGVAVVVGRGVWSCRC